MTQETITQYPKMKLELEIGDVNFILESLGERPAKTNAMKLISEIITQCDPQVPDELKKKE
jgi:hypothetical protein